MMQPKGSDLTYERSGKAHKDVGNPFAAPWNWDDNASGNEVIYFAMRDPYTNKDIAITYEQTQLGSFGFYISKIHIKVSETGGGSNTGYTSFNNDSRYPTFTGGWIDSNSIDGSFEIIMDGSSVDGYVYPNASQPSSSSSFSFSLEPATAYFPTITPDPPNKLTIYLAGFTFEASFVSSPTILSTPTYSINLVPKDTHWFDAQWFASDYLGDASAFQVGGLFYAILNRCVDYTGDEGIVDPNGYPVGSSFTSPLGVWGLFTNESSSSSADPHFIPINKPSDRTNIGIGSEDPVDNTGFLAEPRSNYEGTVSQINSVLVIPSKSHLIDITTVWNLILQGQGYWKVDGWCDPTLLVDGDPICCANPSDDQMAPIMILTVTGNSNHQSFISSSSSSYLVSDPLTINWGGETWTPQEDGDPKYVCPDTYKNFKTGYNRPASTVRRGTHSWQRVDLALFQKGYEYLIPSISWGVRNAGDNQMFLDMAVAYTGIGGVGGFNRTDAMSLRFSGTHNGFPVPFAYTYTPFSGFPITNRPTIMSRLFILLGESPSRNVAAWTFPTYTNLTNFDDIFFHEITIDGITYRWERYHNWKSIEEATAKIENNLS
jgi:hypothetical protein